MSTHAIYDAFVSGRSTPVTTSGSASHGGLMTSTASLRATPPPRSPFIAPQATAAFATSYFGNRPTAEAFAQYRAHRVTDASHRLRNLEFAAMRRAARLRQVRTQQHAAESHRQYVARRALERLQDAQKKIHERLTLAEQRRVHVLEQRVEAQRKAEARREAVRERLQVLKRAGEVIRSADCRAACEAIAPLTIVVEAAVTQARETGSAESYIHGPVGAPMTFPDTMHGRFVFHTTLEKVESILIADARKALPSAASDVLDILLTAADLSHSESPQGSPEKHHARSPQRHADPNAEAGAPTPSKWAVLHDPDYRMKAAMLLIAAHHGAIEALVPGRTESVWRANLAAFTLVQRFSTLVRAAVDAPNVASDEADTLSAAVGGFQVREFLSSLVDFVEATNASKAARQAEMLQELTRAYVQLRLGEAVRQQEIARTKERASTAGAQSAEARRERQVAPRRAILTSAVASQIEKVARRIRAVGGESAVHAAELSAAEAIAALPSPAAA